MNLALELKELALLSHKERVEVAAKDFANKMREYARSQALLGYGSFQNDNFIYLADLDKKIIKEGIKLLEHDGFWCAFTDKSFAMSWGH